MKLIYLASPYSDPDPAIMEARFKAACQASANLMRAGHLIFSPIAHTHPIAQFDLPKGWDFWERYDRAILDACSELFVLTLDGWRTSKGVQAELQIARELGLPVTLWPPERLGIEGSVNLCALREAAEAARLEAVRSEMMRRVPGNYDRSAV